MAGDTWVTAQSAQLVYCSYFSKLIGACTLLVVSTRSTITNVFKMTTLQLDCQTGNSMRTTTAAEWTGRAGIKEEQRIMTKKKTIRRKMSRECIIFLNPQYVWEVESPEICFITRSYIEQAGLQLVGYDLEFMILRSS